MTDFRLPTNKERVTVVGRTGSGKSQLGYWLLSKSDFTKYPWVIVDYKQDELLNSVDRIEEIGLNEVPNAPGLYIVHPRGKIDENAVEDWLWKLWAKERIGIYLDEGYSVPDNGALEALYTQGRSKRIPIITLSQRPAWLSRFVFSEADHYAVFHLNDLRDKKTVGNFTPISMNAPMMPDFHSRWFDVKQNQLFEMKPVPKAEDIQQEIFDRLGPRKRLY